MSRVVDVVRVAAVLAVVCAAVPSALAETTSTVAASGLPVVKLPQPSVSCAHANRGALANGVALPVKGDGYVMVEPWRSRGHHYGTGELVALIERVASRVADRHPGAVLGIADLSQPGGGATKGHRSHQSGRDVDLIYYALDADGRPFHPDGYMPYFSRTGVATFARAPSYNDKIAVRHFDPARNWAMVKAMLTDPHVEVTQMFVSRRVENWLLTYARATGEPIELIELAKRVLWRPKGADPHNDHMHVRIGCSEDDREIGHCREGVYGRRRRRRRKYHTKIACPAPVEVSVKR